MIVLYLFSTSNHNIRQIEAGIVQLSYISFLHQTTTLLRIIRVLIYCLISLFYIKPQLRLFYTCLSEIVLYLFSTSNHNPYYDLKQGIELSYISFLHQTTTSLRWHSLKSILSYISFLHQTTTSVACYPHRCKLSYISFLHQTTTLVRIVRVSIYCLISLFYIKPQPFGVR